MTATVAPDDIVYSHADVAPGARPPLLVLEPLERFLDEHALGAGAIEAQPIGEGHSNVTYLIERDSGPTPTQLVLRRPPRPPLPPSAHDV
ncbi:MAG: phosphotransferase family protein, partial [Solirubrobacteraceae bacterium]